MAQKPTPAFRAEAVRIALTSGLSRKQVASDFGIVFSCHIWVYACGNECRHVQSLAQLGPTTLDPLLTLPFS